MLTSDDEVPQAPRPWFEQPKPVLRTTGTGFDTEAHVVSGPEPVEGQREWPPMTYPNIHRGVPPSPRS